MIGDDYCIYLYILFLSSQHMKCLSEDVVVLHLMQVERQFASRGHSYHCRQLHILIVALILVFIIYLTTNHVKK